MNAKKVLVVIAGVIVIALAWLGYQWFRDPGHQAVPLHPPDTMVQKDAGELGAAVKSLEALAQDAARSIVQAALKDDYLSAKEEREAPNSALAAAEEIKSRAPFPAVVEGFTFKSEDGSEMKVAGFSFTLEMARDLLETEFHKKTTAVKEVELLVRLRGLLKNQAQDDQWLDEKEMETVLNFICTPESGKKAALGRSLAQAAAVSYCKENNIGMGPKRAPAPRP